MKINKRYLVEVQETKGCLGIGRPRIAGTRLGLDLLAQFGLSKFKKYYPETKKTGMWWSQSIKELKVKPLT